MEASLLRNRSRATSPAHSARIEAIGPCIEAIKVGTYDPRIGIDGSRNPYGRGLTPGIDDPRMRIDSPRTCADQVLATLASVQQTLASLSGTLACLCVRGAVPKSQRSKGDEILRYLLRV